MLTRIHTEKQMRDFSSTMLTPHLVFTIFFFFFCKWTEETRVKTHEINKVILCWIVIWCYGLENQEPNSTQHSIRKTLHCSPLPSWANAYFKSHFLDLLGCPFTSLPPALLNLMKIVPYLWSPIVAFLSLGFSPGSSFLFQRPLFLYSDSVLFDFIYTQVCPQSSDLHTPASL